MTMTLNSERQGVKIAKAVMLRYAKKKKKKRKEEEIESIKKEKQEM